MPMLDSEPRDKIINAATSAHLTYYGGPVIQNVRVTQIDWNSSVPNQTDYANFYTAVTQSEYFDWLNEYNTTSPAQSIGRGSYWGKYVDSQTSTSVTDAQIQTAINNAINAGVVPAADNNQIYMVHFPSGVSITSSDGGQSCVSGGFCAYHGTFQRGSQYVYYGVIPDMSGGCSTGCGTSTKLNNTTSVASHELIEAVTDAAVGLATTYGPPLAWYDQTNGEIGDICNGVQGTIASGWTVQKEWSNQQNACIVSKATTTNDFSISMSPTSQTATAGGASVTYTVATGVTAGSAGTVSLSVSGAPSGVTATLGATSVTAGGSTTLTVTAGSSAAAATSTLTVTGTEGTKTHSASATLQVQSGGGGGGGGSVLSNGVPVSNLSGAVNSQQNFTIAIPTGASNLSIKISGGSGDADLYVKFGSAPTLSSYDCRPYINGNAETCSFSTPQVGTYYIMLNGYAAYSGVTLVASYSTGGGGGGGGSVLSNGVPVSNLSGTSGSWQYFTLSVPSGKTSMTIKISGGSGDADLYVRYGAQPTTSTWDYRPYLYGNNETVNVSSPTAGTWYVGIRGYTSYSGVTLVGSYN
jgi:pre-peptidase